MIDPMISTIASEVMSAIAPYLPKIAEKAAAKIGEDLPASVSKIWKKVFEHLSKKPAGKEAVLDAITTPKDTDVQAALRLQIRKELEADPDFREELRVLLGDLVTAGSGITQQGVGNVAIQGGNNSVTQNIGQVANSITNVGYQPRQIPASRTAEFVNQMRAFSGERIDISASMTDPRTHFLANQLTDLLSKAGWETYGDSLSLVDLPKSVHFIVPERLKTSAALDKLAWFLNSCGFQLVLNIVPNESAQMFQLFVNGVD